MTDAELEAIEKACKEATPGPWVHEWRDFSVIAPNETNAGKDYWHVCQAQGRDTGRMQANMHLLGNARQWVPALVAEVRRLRAELAVAGVMADSTQELVVNTSAATGAAMWTATMENAAKVVEGMQRDDQDPDDNAQLRAIAAELRERASRK